MWMPIKWNVLGQAGCMWHSRSVSKSANGVDESDGEQGEWYPGKGCFFRATQIRTADLVSCSVLHHVLSLFYYSLSTYRAHSPWQSRKGEAEFVIWWKEKLYLFWCVKQCQITISTSRSFPFHLLYSLSLWMTLLEATACRFALRGRVSITSSSSPTKAAVALDFFPIPSLPVSFNTITNCSRYFFHWRFGLIPRKSMDCERCQWWRTPSGIMNMTCQVRVLFGISCSNLGRLLSSTRSLARTNASQRKSSPEDFTECVLPTVGW